ncbi:dihydroorotate dehydrogenase [Cytobacillus gottheilii]|uniref:dihydroorotate dehydrogenase n=1 Tax=Cytobacillus gottheilii TaxID=859144 RepID=UPI003CF4E03F
MPDWSYHTIFKPFLSRLPAQTGRAFIHNAMNTMVHLPFGSRLVEFLGHLKPSASLEQPFFKYQLKSRVGLSGRIDPHLIGTSAFNQLGFGFLEIGPVSLHQDAAEEMPLFSEDRKSLYLPSQTYSIGLSQTITQLKKHTMDIPLLIRLRHPRGNAIEKQNELREMAHRLEEFAAAFVIEADGDGCNLEEISRMAASLPCPVIPAIKAEDISIIEWEHLTKHEMILIDTDQHGSIESLLEDVQNLQRYTNIMVSGSIHEPDDAVKLYHAGCRFMMLSEGYVISGPGLPKRINETLADESKEDISNGKQSGWIYFWLFGLCILIGGLIALLFSMSRVILPYDETFLGMTREQLLLVNPKIIQFMAHDRMTLAGTMISGGFLYMQLAKHAVRNNIHWARKAVIIAGTAGFLGILLFIGFGYFDWLHGLLWLILLPFFILGSKKTKEARQSPLSKNRKNTAAWKTALWGQLCFVVLGFSFVIGGIVISVIGVSNVFVSTDLTFICMTPEQLSMLNEQLIPVIAHDRAGFGSALFSVGLLVLMISLWGFHEGASWVWNTLLIGGIPAFAAGISTHFIIGYTSFIHLLPAYFALFLFVAGLLLSRRFLRK